MMAEVRTEPDLTERIRATLGVFITLAGSTCGLTMLYMGMRSVMGVGGFCAEGGPFVIEQHCPKGVPGLVIGGMWGAVIFYGLYVWQVIKHKVPGLILLGWSGLFLSLGWNFLEFGLDAPGPGGLEWGWLTCAIVFGLMGGLPLLAVLPQTLKGFFGAEPAPQPQSGRSVMSSTLGATASMVRNRATKAPRTVTPPPRSTSTSSDFVDELERLTTLHRTGALSASEFHAAKQRLLEGGS